MNETALRTCPSCGKPLPWEGVGPEDVEAVCTPLTCDQWVRKAGRWEGILDDLYVRGRTREQCLAALDAAGITPEQIAHDHAHAHEVGVFAVSPQSATRFHNCDSEPFYATHDEADVLRRCERARAAGRPCSFANNESVGRAGP